MGRSRQGMSRAEADELIDERIHTAIREVTWLMAVVVPELLKAPHWTNDDRRRLAAALHGVAASQRDDGRVAAATAAAALAEALDVQAAKAA